MTAIHVVKSFIFQTPDERKQQFAPGLYEVDEDTAAHPFVQAHLAGFVAPPRATAPSYEQQTLEIMQAVRRNESVAAQAAPVAPPPPGTEVMTPIEPMPAAEDMRGWIDPSERSRHTFAGKAPEALDGPAISLLPSQAP